MKARGVATVGGLIALRLGRVPTQGDRLELGNATLEVEDVGHNRAGWVRVRLRKTAGHDAAIALEDQDKGGEGEYS